MRLDKYLAHATGLTRSRAHGMIRSGQVTVNGEVIKIIGFKVPDGAEVRWREQSVSPAGKRYFMLNKPIGVVCATSDAEHKTVIDLLDLTNKKGLHVAGRLDIDSTGLVLISDDGEWSHRITSPKHGCDKTYRATLAEALDESAVEQFAAGIELRSETKKTLPAKLEILSPTEVRLTLGEGKYHQVKRMFAALGNRVVALHRERIGSLALDETLLPGQWRELSREEVEALSAQ
ncbi:MAG: 16S rRNA pseudouridine(516) synthase RsuA [Gammaproteobacteria bacterium]|nr:16S rRNA pseudouridine(516) synthase RsuA [Gammaproteobacteria bacterium]MCW8957468.1 16S rRNA pseudouridine(516) synthase RsuA [Gammaproteobacteria bacterium]MCW8972822.1 16S rRNA pseudouridine(516) synthase RsuA [Gammaproteobacteria bacterium]MCW8992105.1 16S rRNA pseudouridine(516) synthase RsuA [Gammaproteobacteria bacterium]